MPCIFCGSWMANAMNDDAAVRRVDALEVCSAAGGLLRTLEAGRPARPADIKAAQKVIDGAAWHEKPHKTP